MMMKESIVVGISLDGKIARALDEACGLTLSSRAGFLRRVLVEALRAEGLLPKPATSRKPRGAA